MKKFKLYEEFVADYTNTNMIAFLNHLTKRYNLEWEYLPTEDDFFRAEIKSAQNAEIFIQPVLRKNGIESSIKTRSGAWREFLNPWIVVKVVDIDKKVVDNLNSFLHDFRGNMKGKKFGI